MTNYSNDPYFPPDFDRYWDTPTDELRKGIREKDEDDVAYSMPDEAYDD